MNLSNFKAGLLPAGFAAITYEFFRPIQLHDSTFGDFVAIGVIYFGLTIAFFSNGRWDAWAATVSIGAIATITSFFYNFLL